MASEYNPVLTLLRDLFQAHGHEVHEYHDAESDITYLVIDHSQIQDTGFLTPLIWGELFHPPGTGTSVHRLNVHVVLPYEKDEYGKSRTIIESFAVPGEDEEQRLQEARRRFQDGSFHVLEQALWPLRHPVKCSCFDRNPVTVRTVEEKSKMMSVTNTKMMSVTNKWKLFLGKWVLTLPEGSSQRDFPLSEICGEVVEKVLAQALKENLEHDCTHWFRVSFSRGEDDSTSLKVLLDNERSESIERSLGNCNWPRTGVYNLRWFMVLLPVDSTTASSDDVPLDESHEVLEAPPMRRQRSNSLRGLYSSLSLRRFLPGRTPETGAPPPTSSVA
jgi:hypothetical protein